MIGELGLGPQLESFREVRRNVEASLWPLATSVDGRRFSCQACLACRECRSVEPPTAKSLPCAEMDELTGAACCCFGWTVLGVELFLGNAGCLTSPPAATPAALAPRTDLAKP